MMPKIFLDFEQQPPEKLSDFKKLAKAPEQYNIPENDSKRVLTDKKFLAIFAGLVALTLVLYIYTACHSDHRRSANGYDRCGNICGVRNEHVKGISCSGKDFREYQFSEVTYDEVQGLSTRSCVKECNDTLHIKLNNRCVFFLDIDEIDEELKNEVSKTTADLFDDAIGGLVLSTTISVCISCVMMSLFRFFTAGLIWGFILGGYGLLVLHTVISWFMAQRTSADFQIMIFLTILTAIASAFLYHYFKKIPLVVDIFRECTKVIFAMPLLILEPLLTFVSMLITIFTSFQMLKVMDTAGILTEVGENSYDYLPNGVMIIFAILTILLLMWFLAFLMGCQCMIISGAVSTWYFSSDKNYLWSPIRSSFTTLIKFHLGSVAYGSLIIGPAGLIKLLYRIFSCCKCCCECCRGIIRRFLIYISTFGYIETAMHGESYFKSGKRAVELLYLNLSETIQLNHIKTFVLLMGELCVVMIMMSFSGLIFDHSTSYYPIIVGGSVVLGHLVADCMLKTIAITIDTIYMCYCEDLAINNGDKNPYYATPELLNLFRDTKGAFEESVEIMKRDGSIVDLEDSNTAY